MIYKCAEFYKQILLQFLVRVYTYLLTKYIKPDRQKTKQDMTLYIIYVL